MKIEKCPFCGEVPTLTKNPMWQGSHGYHGCYGFSVKCENEDCAIMPFTRTFHTIYEKDENKQKKKAVAAWNRRTRPEITGNTSDGYHTFNELYHHRAMLFSVICNSRPDMAWKSRLHHDGTMYDGMFIVGINTPDGQATYHYDVEPYWGLFRVPVFPRAPEWDGHTPAQAIERIGHLSTQPENKPLTLDELRQMDGEPVWVMHQDGSGARWGIVKDTEYGLCAVVDDDTAYWFTDVCGTIAYRSKPKEEV